MNHFGKLASIAEHARDLEQSLASERDKDDSLALVRSDEDLSVLVEVHTLVRSAAFLLELATATAQQSTPVE